MYNRYIPQSDGSYSRKSVGNSPSRPSSPPPEKPEHPKPPPVPKPESSPSAVSFLRNLLPREFDTGDLLIVLLLLLMAGEKEDEKSNALLTLALYFFM